MKKNSGNLNSIKIIMVNISVIVTLFLLYASPSKGCTSFAVYGNKIYYGMNFDYADVEIKFMISEINGRKIFQGFFIQGANTNAICGMNNSGLFSSMQMLYPEVTRWHTPQANEMDLFSAYSLVLQNSSDLESALNFINMFGYKVIHVQGLTLHDFFADKNGKSYVLEVGNGVNLITAAENNFLVMTNFPNNQFAGKPLNEITGVGAERYKTAYQYIQANKDNFSFNSGIEILQSTAQTSGDFKTQVSFLCDPVTNEIYIFLKRDFTKIWKLSINDGTIETYLGFSQFHKVTISSDGIAASELQTISSIDENENLIPGLFQLYQNYPNPFNPSTTIRFSLPAETRLASSLQYVTLKIYDILGNEITTLVNEYKPAGEYEISFDASTIHGGLSSGTYIYCLKSGGFTLSKKFILLR